MNIDQIVFQHGDASRFTEYGWMLEGIQKEQIETKLRCDPERAELLFNAGIRAVPLDAFKVDSDLDFESLPEGEIGLLDTCSG